MINVTPDLLNVKVTYNTAPSVPNQGNGTWIVAGNKETGPVNTWHWTGKQDREPRSRTPARPSAPRRQGPRPFRRPDASPTGRRGDGKATEFRFDGSKINGTKQSTISGLDFGEGDTLVFIHYDKGTIADKSGGNLVWNNAEATYVKIEVAERTSRRSTPVRSWVTTKVSGDHLDHDHQAGHRHPDVSRSRTGARNSPRPTTTRCSEVWVLEGTRSLRLRPGLGGQHKSDRTSYVNGGPA